MIYFIQCGKDGPVKIGLTKSDPRKRLKTLQTYHHANLHLLTTIAGGPAVEIILHKRFTMFRLRGEWFEFKGMFAKYIKALPKTIHTAENTSLDGRRTNSTLGLSDEEVKTTWLDKTIKNDDLAAEKAGFKGRKRTLNDRYGPSGRRAGRPPNAEVKRNLEALG